MGDAADADDGEGRGAVWPATSKQVTATKAAEGGDGIKQNYEIEQIT
jgi:hypothetical protein